MLREDRINIFSESKKDVTIEQFGSTKPEDLINVNMHDELFAGSASKYVFKYRGVRVTTERGVSKKHVLKWLNLIDRNYSPLEKRIFEVSSELFTKVKKKDISPSDVKKAVILDHVQIGKADAILGYNTTKDTTLGTKYSIIVMLKKSSRGFYFKVVLDPWKK